MIDPATLTGIARFIGIRGGIAIALGLALAFTMWRADSLSHGLEDAKADLVAERTRHTVTRASVTLLETKMAELVRDGELRAEARDEAIADVERETEALEAQIKDFNIETVEGL